MKALFLLSLLAASTAHADFKLIKSYNSPLNSGGAAATEGLVRNDSFFTRAESCSEVTTTSNSFEDQEKGTEDSFHSVAICTQKDGTRMEVDGYIACVRKTGKCELAAVSIFEDLLDSVVLKTLLDIDGDGKDDVFQETNVGRDSFNNLDITLSKSQRHYKIENVLRNGKGDPREPGFYTEFKLLAGRTGVTIAQSRDTGEAGSWDISFDADVVNGELRLRKVEYFHHIFHMGGESENFGYLYDFAHQKANKMDNGNMHMGLDRKWWKMRGGNCQISFENYFRQGVPTCAREPR